MNSDQKNKEAIQLSIIIPLLNEEESLKTLYDEIAVVCRDNNYTYEVLFIDDGSTDGSFQILSELHNKDSHVKVIQFRTNYGKAEALSTGFRAAIGDWVITMDADLQDDPKGIPHLIEKLKEGYDLVSGWKKKRHDPTLTKRLPSKFFNRVTSMMTGLKLHDYNCGLKIYRNEVIKSVRVYGELHRYIPALAHLQGFRVGELVVHHRPRQYGRTKYGPSRFLNGFLDLVTILFFSKYTRQPLHLFGMIGMISSILGGGITSYLIFMRIFMKAYLSNRPLLFIGILLLILGIQFFSIGLLGEMITRSQADNRHLAIRTKLGV